MSKHETHTVYPDAKIRIMVKEGLLQYLKQLSYTDSFLSLWFSKCVRNEAIPIHFYQHIIQSYVQIILLPFLYEYQNNIFFIMLSVAVRHTINIISISLIFICF